MKIAMLLDGAISNDHRVIKMIETISQDHEVDLYCLEDDNDNSIEGFTDQVKVIKTRQKVNFTTKFLRHSFFCYEFAFLYQKVLNADVQYDYIWANDLPTLIPANACAKALNAKLIYDSHEIYVETINQFFPAKSSFPKSKIFAGLKNLMRRHGKKVERRLIHKVDHFITVNSSILTWFKKEYGIDHGHAIMNIPRSTQKELIPFNYRDTYGFKESDRILLYQGNLNQGRGLEILINSVDTLSEDYKLVLLGNGPLEAILKANSDSTRVKFINTVPIEQLPQYTAGADIGITFLEPINLSKKMASPNKLFEYIHAELPILATKGLENSVIIDTHKVGVLCDLNTSSIVSALNEFDKKTSLQFKENCKKAKGKLRWENQEDEILGLFI